MAAGGGASLKGVLVHTVVGEWAAEGAVPPALLYTLAAVGFGSADVRLSAISRPME